MFEFLTHTPHDAIDLIKKDHDNVKNLFDQFEKASSLSQKRKIAAETILELKLHTVIEEEIFYAAVRKQIEKKIMHEADEEHHVAKILLAELEEMDGTEDHYDAKYTVLAENVRHHIREEESDMLPKARGLAIDFDALGTQILARKAQLKKTGIATFAEEEMVSGSGGKGDSPARAAHIHRPGKPGKVSNVLEIPAGKKTLPQKATAQKAKAGSAKVKRSPLKTGKSAAAHKSHAMRPARKSR